MPKRFAQWPGSALHVKRWTTLNWPNCWMPPQQAVALPHWRMSSRQWGRATACWQGIQQFGQFKVVQRFTCNWELFGIGNSQPALCSWLRSRFKPSAVSVLGAGSQTTQRAPLWRGQNVPVLPSTIAGAGCNALTAPHGVHRQAGEQAPRNGRQPAARKTIVHCSINQQRSAQPGFSIQLQMALGNPP